MSAQQPESSQLPMASCAEDTCRDCDLQGRVHCHFNNTDLLRFMAGCLPGFLLGGWAVWSAGWPWLALWVLLMLLFFGLLEIRVLCSHCPHYAEGDRYLGCWANRGMPKLWKFRPGPMAAWEKAVLLGGFLVTWGYPVGFFLAGKAYAWLGIYVLVTGGFFWMLQRFYCPVCMNFACPFNKVSPADRDKFLEHQPVIARAFGRKPG